MKKRKQVLETDPLFNQKIGLLKTIRLDGRPKVSREAGRFGDPPTVKKPLYFPSKAVARKHKGSVWSVWNGQEIVTEYISFQLDGVFG